MGVFAIANYCNGRGHEVRVANASVFGNRDTAIGVMLRRISDCGAEVVGIPLHWHLSGHDVLQTARFLKQSLPRIRIILGGFTASVYPTEILEHCPFVDAVVVGDGERPFCRYLDALQRSPHDPDLSQVPNLVWRDGAETRHNGLGYVASAADLSNLDFSPQGSLFSITEYANGLRLNEAVAGSHYDFVREPLSHRFFFVNLGRGCSYNCVYCGGGCASHREYAGREGPTIRSPASVLADLERCYAAGFRRFHMSFDVAFPGKDEFFAELFNAVARSIGPDCHLLFEAFGLPGSDFLEVVSRAFGWVGIVISPCFFDADTRRVNKGYSFSDREMEDTIDEIAAMDRCEPFVFFAVTALEDWSDDIVARRKRDIDRIRRGTGVEISVLPIFAEPGSPWVSLPEVCGGRTFDLIFEDFSREWRKPLNTWNDRLTGVEDIDRVMARFERE
jgi:hypothetical protein